MESALPHAHCARPELFDEALALEPDFAGAMAARVRSYSALNSITGEIDREFLADGAYRCI